MEKGTYFPLPLVSGRGKDAVEPRFVILVAEDNEMFDTDFDDDLLDCFDFMHSDWNCSLQL